MSEQGVQMDEIVKVIQPVLDAIRGAGGRPLIVGGAVRDMLLGLVPRDADIETYGLGVESLVTALAHVGKVNIVGQAFGVLKVTLPSGVTIDVSVPRTENKIGKGHRAFATQFGSLSPEQAAARRDFTINSVAFDPATGGLIDPYGGAADLKAKILRHTSPAFAEDPLRVLRGMQFAARFELRMAPETIELSRSLLPEAGTLAVERVWEEWLKWAEQGKRPGLGLRVLAETGWIELYPELSALIACPQDREWHPEGDVFEHTSLVCDAAAEVATRDGLSAEERLVLLLGALCHDLGKPMTTVHDADGHIRSPGHTAAGVPLTQTFLERIGCWRSVINAVVPLVREHMVQHSLPLAPRSVRRLALRLSPTTIVQWGHVVESDNAGRPPLPPENPAAPFVALARQLEVEDGKPKPILLGRHLATLGVPPGPEMGTLLRAAYEAQISGEFESLEDALGWAEQRIR